MVIPLPRLILQIGPTLLALGIGTTVAGQASAQSFLSSLTHSQPINSPNGFGSLPLSFEANRGQSHGAAAFVAHGQGYSLSLGPTEARFDFPVAQTRSADVRKAAIARTKSGTTLTMQLLGASRQSQIGSKSPLPGKVNYLVGADPKQWKTDIPTFRQVKCEGVYPGIDLVYYGNQRQLEYDFIVAPHADPSRIALRFGGADTLKVDKTGDLLVGLHGGSVRWHKPVVYQNISGQRKSVMGRFVKKSNGVVGFAVARYDVRRPLVIDPVLAYSTFLGGNGNDAVNGIALDASGNAYVTGTTDSSNFPGTTGGNHNAAGFVAKLDPSGTRLLYSTYIGAAFGQAVTVDSAGNAYVVGSVPGATIPVIRGYQASYGGGVNDGFLMVVNAAGNGVLYSTFIGGSDQDAASSVALGPDGTVYIAGYTYSTNFRTASALQAANAGGQDAFVVRLNTSQSGNASLLFGTYYGGSGFESANGIAVDSSGRFCIAGGTSSPDLPKVHSFQNSLIGGQNLFVAAFAPGGAQVTYSSYLGGVGSDYANSVAMDNQNNAYVTGASSSANFPLRKPIQGAYGGGSTDAIAAKFSLGATGSASLVYSTFLGGTTADAGYSIATDVWGNAAFCGYSFDAGGFQHVFVAKINSAGGKLLYGRYFGGTANDLPTTLALDPLGYAIVGGTTSSTDFPVTPGALQTAAGGSGGTRDAFVFRLPTFTRLDFNRDTMPDLLFQNTTDFSLVDWVMHRDQVASTGFLNPASPGPNWKVVGSADLNGDGYTDLLFQNSVTGDLVYWLMSSTTETTINFVTPRNPGANWNVVGMADFNRDGYSDILFQNSATGALFIWYMRGATLIGAAPVNAANPGPGLKVAATGDLNNDGQADIVLQNSTTGDVQIWFMRGDTLVQSGATVPANPGPGWNVVGLADLAGSGKPQILFQNGNTGALAYWVMNGFNIVRIGIPNPSNPGGAVWKLVGSN